MTQTSDLQASSKHRGDRAGRAGERQATHSSAALPAAAAPRDDLRMQHIVSGGTALLSACLVPAAAMAALWSAADVGGSAFVLTFGMAFVHTILLGLPLFLIFRARGWVNAATCVIAGFAIGAVPASVLSWPAQHPQIHAAIRLAGWGGYLMPPARFGMFGALGGAAFWLVLSNFSVVGKSAVHVRFLQSRRRRA